MAQDQKLDDPYMDLRTQAYSDKSFLGGSSMSTRTAMYFFVGVLVLGALAGGFLYLDERLARALESWKQSQKVSLLVSNLKTAIEDVRIQDGRVRADSDPGNVQAHRRSIDRVAIALGALQSSDINQQVQDSVITVRDAFADYGEEFLQVLENRRSLGADDNSGVRAEYRDADRNVRESLNKNDLGALLAEFDDLDRFAIQDRTANPEQSQATVESVISNLTELVSQSDVSDDVKRSVQSDMDEYASALRRFIMIGYHAAKDLPAYDDILDYIGPAVQTIVDFSNARAQTTPVAYETELLFARQATAAGAAGAVLIVVGFGLIVIRSITGPIRRMTFATENLARGDRFLTVPLRGNTDSIGRMARALDHWLDHLAELDHMRAELDDARMRLAMDIAFRIPGDEQDTSTRAIDPEPKEGGEAQDDNTAPSDGETEAVPWRALGSALGSDDGLTSPEEGELDISRQDVDLTRDMPSEVQDTGFENLNREANKTIPGSLERFVAATARSVPTSIGAASQEINQIMAYVTAAAVDVERTEALVQSLGDTNRQLGDLEICVSTIRDEANLIAFRTGEKSGDNNDDNTLVYLSSERGTMQRTPEEMSRFDRIRDNVARAERLVLNVRKSLDSVTTLAQEVASTASSEALAATNRLLSQSEYLQNMLDDLVKRIAPNGLDQSEDTRSSDDA